MTLALIAPAGMLANTGAAETPTWYWVVAIALVVAGIALVVFQAVRRRRAANAAAASAAESGAEASDDTSTDA